MFEAERAVAAERLQEVRALHQMISELESPDPLQPEASRVLVLRGLFFVLLYAYFESSINRLVSATLSHISGAAISTSHFDPSIFSLALNPQLTSLESSGETSKWKRRVDLFLTQNSNTKCMINDSVLSKYLQNIWHASIEQVFSCLGVQANAVPTPRHIGYIDELVEKRNAISHGRSSAEDVGRRYRSPELLLRLDAITEVSSHIENTLSLYLEQYLYIKDGLHKSSTAVLARPLRG